MKLQLAISIALLSGCATVSTVDEDAANQAQVDTAHANLRVCLTAMHAKYYHGNATPTEKATASAAACDNEIRRVCKATVWAATRHITDPMLRNQVYTDSLPNCHDKKTENVRDRMIGKLFLANRQKCLKLMALRFE